MAILNLSSGGRDTYSLSDGPHASNSVVKIYGRSFHMRHKFLGWASSSYPPGIDEGGWTRII